MRTSGSRIGPSAAIAGAIVLFIGTYLHPMSADPNVPRAAFAEYAASQHWVAIHLMQLVGVIFDRAERTATGDARHFPRARRHVVRQVREYGNRGDGNLRINAALQRGGAGHVGVVIGDDDDVLLLRVRFDKPGNAGFTIEREIERTVAVGHVAQAPVFHGGDKL